MEPDTIRIIIGLVMMCSAVYLDIRYRQIHDVFWVAPVLLGALLIVTAPDVTAELVTVGISLLVAPVALLFWRVGVFGGADALGIITLAILVPGITITGGAVTPFTILLNALVFSVLAFFGNFVRNRILLWRGVDIFEGIDETRFRRTVAMFIGHRTANPKYGFSMQGNDGKLYLKLQHAGRAKMCSGSDTWVTLGSPYMIFILAGLLVQLLHGDILFGIFNYVSRFG